MHEFNFCQTIVDTVLDRLARTQPPALRLVKTTVVVGRLRGLVAENLAAAYAQLTAGTAAQGSTLLVRMVPARGVCAACGWTGEVNGAGFACAKCGATAGQLLGGRELHLESIEVEQEE